LYFFSSAISDQCITITIFLANCITCNGHAIASRRSLFCTDILRDFKLSCENFSYIPKCGCESGKLHAVEDRPRFFLTTQYVKPDIGTKEQYFSPNFRKKRVTSIIIKGTVLLFGVYKKNIFSACRVCTT